MKTTIDIADALLAEAQRVAARDDTTLRALVNEALRRLLDSRKAAKPYVPKDCSFGGDGLTPEFRDLGWDAIRAASHGLPPA